MKPVAGAIACYNGNISEWEWQQGTNVEQLYGFTYDPVSRLKETNQYRHAGTTWSVSPNDYVEKGITYDRNGNILTLQRTGNGTLADNLSYTYTGNQLTALQESVRTSLPEDIYQPGATPNGTYEYDANGNMKKDSRKSLTFNYNYLNLLSVVKENNAVKASYRYLADGTKVSVRNGNGNTGYDYEGSFVYTVTNNTPTLEAVHFTDGQLKATGVNYTLTDHLGSVRALVDANGTLLEQNDYYPFGSRHVNASYASAENRYTFNGKEEQDLFDLNMYDFGARMYDSSIARWATVDPLCEKYNSETIYGYCMNNPIAFIDPEGEEVIVSSWSVFMMILDTLTPEDRFYVSMAIDAYGCLDKDMLNNYKSESYNYNAFLELVNSPLLISVSFEDNNMVYMDEQGNLLFAPMTYFEPEEVYVDKDGKTLNGTTTGESGRMGVTLLPGLNVGSMNSYDNDIHIVMNENLSRPARAEMYSHEANGHALMYIRTGDRKQSAHDTRRTSIDYNIPLRNMIIKSKQETVKNMKRRK